MVKKSKSRANPAPTPIRNPTLASLPFSVGLLVCLNSAFSVDIDDNRTVDDLKKAIVKEKSSAFANYDADQLKLWKVGGFTPLSLIHAHNFPERYPSRSTNTSFSTEIPY